MKKILETIIIIFICFALYRYSERFFDFIERIFGKFFGLFDFIEDHFLTVVCLIGASILGVMYMKANSDDELPSNKYDE